MFKPATQTLPDDAAAKVAPIACRKAATLFSAYGATWEAARTFQRADLVRVDLTRGGRDATHDATLTITVYERDEESGQVDLWSARLEATHEARRARRFPGVVFFGVGATVSDALANLSLDPERRAGAPDVL